MFTNKIPLGLTVTFCLSLALLGGCRHRQQTVSTAAPSAPQNPVNATDKNDNSADLAIKQERREQFTLQPGTRVFVQGINGKVDIATSETDKAEVYLVRSANKNEDFEERQVTIERDEDGDLIIQVRNNRQRSIWAMLGSRHDERQRLELKLPRNVSLEAHDINGNTSIGELDGPLTVSGMNGDITAARVTKEVELRGINGNSRIAIANLTKQLRMRGINGNLDFTFTDTANAELRLRGINGKITNELPNSTVREQEDGKLVARIGDGSASIEGFGVNGNINFLSAVKAATPNSKLAKQ